MEIETRIESDIPEIICETDEHLIENNLSNLLEFKKYTVFFRSGTALHDMYLVEDKGIFSIWKQSQGNIIHNRILRNENIEAILE